MSRSETDERGFQRVIKHIADKVDFEPGYYNDAYLGRRITARMRRCKAEDYDSYLTVLRRDDEERDLLLDSLTVNVTNFFRNPEMWEALRPVLRELTAERRRVNAWSAPCADGREPYSMAMLAKDDPEIVARKLSILGTDIDREALAAARRGEYETTRTTDIGGELEPLSDAAAYVRQEGDQFRVRDAVTRLVEFERHDLIRDGSKSDFDLVMCRNLLIYIDTEYKQAIFDTITDSIRDGGYLVIGMTESLPPASREVFTPVDKRRRIYRKE
jgi:chemotaxis protein methyltransferase CheR